MYVAFEKRRHGASLSVPSMYAIVLASGERCG